MSWELKAVGFQKSGVGGHRCMFSPFIEAIEALPLANTPEVFGLHPNAEIGYYTQAARDMWAHLLELQPQTGKVPCRQLCPWGTGALAQSVLLWFLVVSTLLVPSIEGAGCPGPMLRCLAVSKNVSWFQGNPALASAEMITSARWPRT